MIVHRAFACLAFTAGLAVWICSSASPVTPGKAESRARRFRLPLYFIENQGQVAAPVRYYLHGRDSAVYFTGDGMVVALSEPNPAGVRLQPVKHEPATKGRRWAVKLGFVGARADAEPEGIRQSAATVSYFKGPRETWKTGVATYGGVLYRDLWPGIDLVWEGEEGRLKSNFIVRAGADPGQIRLRWEGAANVRMGAKGAMEVDTPAGGFAEEKPVAYQEAGGRRVEVAAAYWPNGGEYGFRLGRFDRSRELIIDPVVLLYAGYIGGSGDDWAAGIAVDGAGSAYLTGSTESTEATFPKATGPDLTYNGATDVFVAKVNAAGTALVYAGYIGGSARDSGYGIAVDGAGNAYVTGSTESTEATFPVTGGPDLTYNGGAWDAFVAKVNAAGTALVYAGYVGGSEADDGIAIAVDGAGNAYLTGSTSSAEATFPVAAGPDLTYNGATDAFLAKVSPSGATLLYAGYIGGSGSDQGDRIAVDAAGNAYVIGSTESTQATFPVAAGPDLTHNGLWDTFVAKVNASGTALVYAGYIGGAAEEYGSGIAVDGAGNAYVTGYTDSTQTTFPVTAGPDLTHNGLSDAFVAKINASGTALVYAGYMGGSGADWGTGIAVDGAGNAYVTGETQSQAATFPAAAGPDLTHNGLSDIFVAKVNASGTALVYVVRIGGSGSQSGTGIALDGAGNAYLTGMTDSGHASFPVTGGPDLTYNGGWDAFVVKVSSAMPTAAFRDAATSVRLLTRYISPQVYNAGGLFASDPAVAQTAQGNTVVVARDSYGSLWANQFVASTQTWGAWSFGGGITKGQPAVAVAGNGTAYIASRDNWNSYWLASYTPGGSFGSWTYLAGIFSEDPAMAACPDGSLYLIGRDNWRSLWSGRYAPETGFQGWRAGGGIIQGKPAVACGKDNVAYVVVRDDWNSLWLARVQGDGWLGWSYGGGIMSGDPQVAAARDGTVYAVLRDSWGVLWYRGYTEGTAQGWLPWVMTGGVLQDFSAAGELGEVYVAGRSAANELWWYRLAINQWTNTGNPGVAAGPLAAAPR